VVNPSLLPRLLRYLRSAFKAKKVLYVNGLSDGFGKPIMLRISLSKKYKHIISLQIYLANLYTKRCMKIMKYSKFENEIKQVLYLQKKMDTKRKFENFMLSDSIYTSNRNSKRSGD